MNDGFDVKLRVATVGALALVVAALLMNTCAMDRLEQQVIEQRKVLERVAGGGGGGGPVTTAAPGARPDGKAVPGTGTGVFAVGWGGRRAEVLHAEGAVPEGVFRIADKPLPQNDAYVNRRNSPPKTFNYYATNEGETSNITPITIRSMILVNRDAPPKVDPDLAISWDVSEDKLTYTYRLRRGVQFADGRLFTSADVKFSFDVMRDPAVNAEHLRSAFDDVESLTTPDDHTVVVKYKKKYWPGIYSVGFSLRILNKGWYEEQIPVWAKKSGIEQYATEPGKPGFGEVFNKIRIPCPGAGPYYWAQDDYDPAVASTTGIEWVQNPFWYGWQVHPRHYNFPKLRWRFISDDVAAFEEFRKQGFDVSTVDFNTYDDEYSKDPTISAIARYEEYDHIGLAFSHIAWNCRQPPFDDPRVRRAMTMLMDREWIVKEIERGRAQVATCPTKPIYPEYSHDIKPIPFDIEGARKLLAEAGWKDSDGDGVLDRNGKRFEWELKVGSPRRFYTQVGAALQDACKKAGIRMSLRTLEWATFIQDLEERRFDAVCLYASFADPWVEPSESYHSSQDVPRGGNISGWRNAKADQLLEQFREEFDEKRRAELFHEFNHVFDQEQPHTLLVHGKVGVLVNKRFEEIKVRPTGLQYFDWWTKPENVLYK